MNYDYGRFIEEIFKYAPRVLIIGDKRIINPKEEHYLQAGYKKIVKTPIPVKEGYYYTSKIINDNVTPIQIWEEHEIVPEVDNE